MNFNPLIIPVVVALGFCGAGFESEAATTVDLTPDSCATVVHAIAASRLDGTTKNDSLHVSELLGEDFITVTETVYQLSPESVSRAAKSKDDIIVKRICRSFE